MERFAPWLLRAMWIVVVVLAIPAIDAACEDRSDAIHDVARIVGGALWVLGVAAMAVPAVISLTATRLLVPLSIPASLATAFGGAGTASAVAFVAVALTSTFLASSAPLGRAFVQASAYGDEDRHLLRPPQAYLAAVVLTWIV